MIAARLQTWEDKEAHFVSFCRGKGICISVCDNDVCAHDHTAGGIRYAARQSCCFTLCATKNGTNQNAEKGSDQSAHARTPPEGLHSSVKVCTPSLAICTTRKKRKF